MIDKKLESVTEEVTSQMITRPKPNIDNEVGAITRNYLCSKPMIEILTGFEQACQKDIPFWKFQDVTSNSILVQRLLGLKQLRAPRKTALVLHFEIFSSDETLAQTIQQALKEVNNSASEYAVFEITGAFYSHQSYSKQLKPTDEAFNAIHSWVTAEESAKPKSDISIEYFLITDARVHELDQESNQQRLRKFTVPFKNYIRAAVYTTQVGEEVRTLMSSVLDVDVDVDVAANPAEALRQYISEKRYLDASIKEAQTISDDLLYSELILQHAANVDALVRITEQLIAGIKNRSFAENNKRVYDSYVREIKNTLSFFEFEEQDFLNRLARQKLAVQEIVNSACEEKVKNAESRIYLKKVTMQMKIESADIRKEVDQTKYTLTKQLQESNLFQSCSLTLILVDNAIGVSSGY